MEASSATTSTAVAGPSSEASTPAVVYDNDDLRHGHFAITASQVPKPTTSMPPIISPNSTTEPHVKDVKSIGARFHEDCYETDLPEPRRRSSRMFKGKEPATLEQEKRKPLRLLDLPVDILKDIVREVTHTNDLTSLALCHSALHRLTVPHIYSRFDIVWPDSSTHTEPRSGVDALTYGLATLVMAEEIFGESPKQREAQNNRFLKSGQGRATETAIRRRRGNHYAQFTKKFSLGNGPADWVQEYLITKEGGKMLGTLVALAVARMRSLETFIWDMPTGILRDVWLALSSLGDREDGRPCKLEKVWVRWHDNSSPDTTNPIPPPPAPINLSSMPPPPLQTSSLNAPLPQIHPAALDRVEHPSFSTLPALKSLSVLDIDELAYLDEMAVLISNSLDKLRELRVGIARHAMTRDWVTVWEGGALQQVDPNHPTAGSLTIGEKRLGGVLGILTGFVCDLRQLKDGMSEPSMHRRTSSADRTSVVASDEEAVLSSPSGPEVNAAVESGLTIFREVIAELPSNEPEPVFAYSNSTSMPNQQPAEDVAPVMSGALPSDQIATLPQEFSALPSPEDQEVLLGSTGNKPPHQNEVLKLQSLELERVPISVPVLQKAIDWTHLTSLTLLHCHNHEQLWKTLRRTFAPTPKSPAYPHPRRIPNSTSRKGSKAALLAQPEDHDYKLNLKKIHTNTVSPAMISFVKETLAPNSLEVLFLQEARSYPSTVAVDAIYRGLLRRHRASLKKVLIDSSEKGSDGLPMNSSRWRKWMLTREILGFVCGGKMPALRELGMAIDYRDWHFFLQHLPQVPQLRSLYLPFLADHVHGANVDPRELALQIVDIVALRPEVELCYVGVANKCFEIMENVRRDIADVRSESAMGITPATVSEDDDDEDDDVEEVDDGDEDEQDDTESDDDDDADELTDDEDEGGVGGFIARQGCALRLREILFYDDKVAIFKARHGRL